jgi:small multidrug resistance pump
MAAWALLMVAISAEVFATSALPRTQGFHDPLWTALCVAGYAVSIWLLTLVVEDLPVSVAYAVWAGVGTAGIAVIGVLFLGEHLDPLKVLALALIVLGVVVLNLTGSAH